jgi:hypothetical protein
MRIVLQNSKTGLYLKSLNKWTPHSNEALAFVDPVRAHDYSVCHRLAETVIVPLPERRGASARRESESTAMN